MKKLSYILAALAVCILIACKPQPVDILVEVPDGYRGLVEFPQVPEGMKTKGLHSLHFVVPEDGILPIEQFPVLSNVTARYYSGAELDVFPSKKYWGDDTPTSSRIMLRLTGNCSGVRNGRVFKDSTIMFVGTLEERNYYLENSEYRSSSPLSVRSIE